MILKVNRCFISLNNFNLILLLLYHFEQLKYQEIATLLQIPIGTVMNRIFRARNKLRERWGALGGDLDTVGIEAAG